ncbi:MAG: hypothetical protein V1765_02120 [bacterium]
MKIKASMVKAWQSQLGLTFVEVIIVVGMFSGLILATTRVFVKTTDIQLRTVNEHDLQADLKYGLGVLLYEAEKDVVKCTVDCFCHSKDLTNKFYAINDAGTALYFFNSSDLCVAYLLDDDTHKITVQRGGGAEETLTSEKINITDFNFVVNTNADRFTVMAKAQKTDQTYQHQLFLQTSITATNYED